MADTEKSGHLPVTIIEVLEEMLPELASSAKADVSLLSGSF